MPTDPSPGYRKIIHIDMDAFFASVEQRDYPEYRGKPLVVGGKPDTRGVVATASYEARKYGVRSAMSCRKAAELCPHAIFVYPRFEAYKKVSDQIRAIFSRYTDLIEPLSLDEAFLDVTTDKLQIGSALEIAKRIKNEIREELGLTASAGVSVNKFVAKIASDLNKPDGMTFIGPSKVEEFVAALPVEKFFGVGKVTAAKMKKMQLFTGADLKRLTERELIRRFGKAGSFYFKIVNGQDDRPVQPFRETKSQGVEDTFPSDLDNQEELYKELDQIAGRLVARLERKKLKGRTLTLKVKFADFKQITRNSSFSYHINDFSTISSTAKSLFDMIDRGENKVRLLGITLSNFEGGLGKEPPSGPAYQLSLFSDLDF